MKSKDIENLIDALNAQKMRDRIILVSLSEFVDVAKVWMDEPHGKVFDENPYDFYFIKNDEGLYLAAVLDMTSDLHGFVKNAHRKNGHLSRAINNIILPKLYQDGRRRQKVTFEEPEMAIYCKTHWGFSIASDTSAVLDLSIFSEHPKINFKRNKLSDEDLFNIKLKLRQAKFYLTIVKEQLQMSYEDANSINLEGYISNLSCLENDIFEFVERKQGDFLS